MAMLCPVAALLCSCRPTHSDGLVEVVDIAKVIDTNQPGHDMCSDLVMSKADVVRYFSVAEAVDAADFHDQAIILPCKYQGTIRMDGHFYRWEIFAGGAGYLYDNALIDKRYLCTGKCLALLPNLP